MARPERASPEDTQGAALTAAVRHADLTLEQLWTRYFALGGNADLMDVDAHLAGLLPLPPGDRDMLAHAVNERLDELTAAHRAPYTRPIRPGRPTTGPLAALVELLMAAGAAPPERLASIAARAGRLLGVEVSVYLVDHEQRGLVHLTADGRPGRPPLGLEGTLGGRAFRTLRILSSEREQRPGLYVPLVDGADRLGVVEARLTEAADLYDPVLREQLTWLSSLLGHLIASMGDYGDELERPRRNRPADRLRGVDLATTAPAHRGDGLLRPGRAARAELRRGRGRVRRLTQAVLRHQGGLLQDDATILLATWRREPPPAA
jgi:hypothetical protein